MLKKGTKVRIIRNDYENGDMYVGCTGVVTDVVTDVAWCKTWCKAGVRLDTIVDGRDFAWFDEQNLSVVSDSYYDAIDSYCDAINAFRHFHDSVVYGTFDIKKIIFSGPKTIVLWGDGTKTIVSCKEGDTFDQYAGFCAAVTKKIFGSTSNAKKILGIYSKGEKEND